MINALLYYYLADSVLAAFPVAPTVTSRIDSDGEAGTGADIP